MQILQTYKTQYNAARTLPSRKHLCRPTGQSLACLPVLEADDVSVCGVELAEAEVGLLGDDDVGVVVLKAW
jgi:hypothetical protein